MYIILFCQIKTVRVATPSWAAASSFGPAGSREESLSQAFCISYISTQILFSFTVQKVLARSLRLIKKPKGMKRSNVCPCLGRTAFFSTHPPILSMAIYLMYLVIIFLRAELAFPRVYFLKQSSKAMTVL